MLRKRLVYLMIIVAVFIFAGCSGHMTKVNTPDQVIKDFSSITEKPENFKVSRVFIIPFHELAYDSEGMYGLNYPIKSQKEGSEKDDDNIKKSADLHIAQILKIDGEQKLVLFDYGNKFDTARRVLINSRVEPGIQFPIEGGLEKVCARGIKDFNWKYFKTMDEYIADGTVSVIEINKLNDAGYQRANALIFDILAKAESLGNDTAFEKFLKSLGSFSTNEIHLMIASSFNEATFFPAVGVKVFSVIRALSGAANLDDIYYYTKKASAFDVAAMLYNNVKYLKTAVQHDVYAENKLQNHNLYNIEIEKLKLWLRMSKDDIERWRQANFNLEGVDPGNQKLGPMDRKYVAQVNKVADGSIRAFNASFTIIKDCLKELFNE